MEREAREEGGAGPGSRACRPLTPQPCCMLTLSCHTPQVTHTPYQIQPMRPPPPAPALWGHWGF